VTRRRPFLRCLLPATLLAAFAVALPASADAATDVTATASARMMPSAQNLPQVNRTILRLVNHERRIRGLHRLHRDRRLERAATKFSRVMVFNDFFSHVSPGGSTVLSRVKATGYLHGARGWTVGENIAFGTGHYATPAETVDAWMHSPGHRANILHPGFKEIGIGIALGAPGYEGGATYTTDFGTRL
jgi:uncharacterized protein YkwD